MLREAVNGLGIYGVVNTTAEPRRSLEEELSIALAGLWPEPEPMNAIHSRIAPVVPASATVEKPRFVVIPRVTRGMARRAAPPPPAPSKTAPYK